MSANRLNVLVTLMLAVALLVTESGNAQMNGNSQSRSAGSARSPPQRYCGKKLSNALQLICDGVYNSMFKKNEEPEMEMADYPLTYEFSPPYTPFLSRTMARAILDGRLGSRRYRRQSRGIHEECCLNACTISELSTYCAS
ncbi:PREDICTED: LIRP-like [Vollenhovia emeryi]|uniref:LIRP-like n=1 Tax=Vollenhovia emeryi TaxID=411798 RepID=UPI0005F41581|nr:PREDICTED: LIRP-like [Vollenhovia emeryi]XP_011863844.1 PREDICTED: LIRP-like [Vollenhovia emeryi]